MLFNKKIFVQSILQYWKLWLIFTGINVLVICSIIFVYDDTAFYSITEAVKGTNFADFVGTKLASFTSLLGTLSEAVYRIIAVFIALGYELIVANGLVAGEVDRGSMAYTLSSKIPRRSVVFSKALFLVFSLFMMFFVIFFSGSAVIQLKFESIFVSTYTKDVRAAGLVLGLEQEELSSNLLLIKSNEEALKAGAKARKLGIDEYTEYLNAKIKRNALLASAEVLNMSLSDLESDISIIKENKDALAAGAKVMGMSSGVFSVYLTQTEKMSLQNMLQNKGLQDGISKALFAASQELGVQATTLISNMALIKNNPKALTASAQASGFDEMFIVSIINQTIGKSELNKDNSNFSLRKWILLNISCFILLLAFSSISFFASCFFNLSKYSIALGAGIPLFSQIMHMMANTDESLAGFKYVSINTLFPARAIVRDEMFIPQLVILLVFALILYSVGMYYFSKKDLPL